MRSLRATLLLAAMTLLPAAVIADSYDDTIARFKKAGASAQYFDSSYGYAVLPTIGKGGLIVGGAHGSGRVYQGGQYVGDTSMTQVSIGLQIGGQYFSYVLFFMTRASLEYLHSTRGWSVGTGPSITVINRGAAGSADVRSLSEDVYAFPFNGKGLMADLTLQGTKITPIHPK